VEHQVRHRVEQVPGEHGTDQQPVHGDRGDREAERHDEVQLAHVGDQVRVVGREHRYPIVSGQREVVVEHLRKQQRPDSDHGPGQGEERQAGP
jgi:hypothetical protein